MMNTQTASDFSDFYLSKHMLKALEGVGYVQPTPVQTTSIPLVMAGIDLIVQSQTGSGKTAAFAIPTLEMLGKNPGVAEVLVLAPTRELARQVAVEFDRLSGNKLDIATIYGGVSYEKQYKELETAQVICATPGRLLDILKSGNLDLSKLQILILDEADEMLSMGFAEDLNAIISFLPEDRQSLLFSATITDEVKSLSAKMLFYPEYVSHSDDSVAATDVQHMWYPVTGVGRARDLLRVLEYEEPESAIIFANTRDDTFMVTKFLRRHGLRADVINGDLPQKERERTLKSLREGKTDILVATDVAARGIDISDLSHVFNFTLPDSAEVYIHRTGRTGRAGKKGRAISLISPREVTTLFNVRKQYKVDMTKTELPSPEDLLRRKQETAIEKLADTVSSMGNIAYGSKLGVAQQLLNSDDPENLRLLAKLLTLAESTSAAPVVEVKEVEEVEEVEAAPQDTADEPEDSQDTAAEAADADADGDDSGKRRRRRRSRSEKSDEKPASEPANEIEVKADDDEGRNRRRRRRGRKSDDSAPEAKAPAAEASDEKSDDKPKRNGRDSSKGRGRSRKSSSKPPRKQESKPQEPMSKIWINLGQEQFDSDKDVVEMICHMAGLEPEDVGSVSVEKSFSYAEVREYYFYDIINAINNQEWQGVTVAAEPARK